MSLPAMLAIIASLLLQVAATPAPPADLMQDPDVLGYCRSLVAKSAAEKYREQGAFVVRNRDGLLYFVPWPPGRRTDQLRWRGRIPEGAVAIVHTHPPMGGAASKIDAATARRTGLPVYILTSRYIVRTTGETSEVVKSGKW